MLQLLNNDAQEDQIHETVVTAFEVLEIILRYDFLAERSVLRLRSSQRPLLPPLRTENPFGKSEVEALFMSGLIVNLQQPLMLHNQRPHLS
jgi:hypothetical protein